MSRRQIDLERDGVIRGVERYQADLAQNRAADREFEGGVGRTLTTVLMTDLVPAVRALQRTGLSVLNEHWQTGRRTNQWEPHMNAVGAEELAYITIRSALSIRASTSTLQNLGTSIGRMVNLQLNWTSALAQEKAKTKAEADHRNRLMLMQKRVKHINPRSVRKWLKKLDDLCREEWSNDIRQRVGCELGALLVQTCPDWFEYRSVVNIDRGRFKTRRTIQRTKAANEALERTHDQAAAAAPWLEPMVCPPADWQWNDDAEAYEGGYLTHQMALVKRGMYSHTSALMDNDIVPPAVLDAVNTIQRTPWAINTQVLEVAIQARRDGDEALLPVAPERDLPELVSQDAWAALDKQTKASAKIARKNIHDHNHKLKSAREDLRRKLVTAGTFKDEEAIWFPHSLDFRGRCYPLPQDLHPQADDISRSLLRFADAKVLGADGLKYLTYHIANCYGIDKCSRYDQTLWVAQNNEEIFRVALDPLGTGRPFLAKADKPWQFLAAAIEIVAAWEHDSAPEEYASSLPVFVDGSCNGLQHLSAMIRDKVGAEATNLTGSDVRQDIYGIIADKVIAQVKADCLAAPVDPPLSCHHWRGHVHRKTVKRAVMTTPYGLTDVGMRDQLIKDKHCAALDGDVGKNATYMRNVLKACISSTVVASSMVMKWLQINASTVAHADRPVTWTTPIGFVVRQAYYKTNMRRVCTVAGVAQLNRLSLYEEAPAQGLQVRKQADAVAPNVIHSFDSAHMMLSVLAAHEEGINHFAVIHDSFGCHAADMGTFLVHIRREFVHIYRENWIKRLQADLQASAPDADLEAIEVFTGGQAHDIAGTARDEYFFA